MADHDGPERLPGWFGNAGLGMFVHWSHAAVQGLELSWAMVGNDALFPHSPTVSVAEYEAGAEKFDPEPGAAERWADLAAGAGMAYGVLTAKHHDGYSMFFTEHSDYSVEHSPCGRDLVAEYVEAFRSRGLRVGLYYSLSDWHHPDYPAFTDDDRPYQFAAYRRPEPEAWDRYRDHLFGQVTELLTNYGPVDLLWFDGGWERTADEWRAGDLRELIRSLQPDTIVNDRLPGQGDYETPEQFVPAQGPEGPWETCLTMNSSWGYVPGDTSYKSATALVHALCETAGRGGNLLLNASPRADGSLPPEQVERLEAIGRWVHRHEAAVRATGPGLEPWQFYGPSTRDGNTYYLMALARPYESVSLRGVPVRRAKSVRDLGTGTALAWRYAVAPIDELINPDPVGELIIRVPDEVVDEFATVVAVEFEPAT